jgi:NADH dehydrogenase
VELAGAAAEIARDFLRVEFRHLHQERARIVLVDVAPRILPAFHPSLSAAAARALEDLGVEVHVGVKVVAITESAVTTDDPKLLTIPTKTSLWAAGVEASPLARLLGEAAGLDVDRAGRVPVTPQLTLDGHPEVFVIGDMARCEGGDGVPLPGVAPVAIQQGRHVARTIRRRLRALPPTSFTYSGRGNLATIGRSRAVAQLGSWRFSGRFAWWVWLFIHLMQLVSLQNRLLVLIQWAGTYVTRNRSARIITLPDRGHDPRPEQHQPGVRERDHQKP